MFSQWQCIQQNIGTWYGSFTKFSPEGEQVKDTPSVLTLEETDPGKTMRLTLKRTPPGGTTDVTTRSFSAPGPAPYVYFFESGAFTQGSAQWTAFAQFGAEMCLTVGDRRARFVIMYESGMNGSAQIKYVVLIRETQTEGTYFKEPAMTPGQMMGSWAGTLSAVYATMEPTATGASKWQFDQTSLICQDAFGENTEKLLLKLEQNDASQSVSLKGDLAYKLMCLPNGAYCLIPEAIEKASEFRLEVGWLRAGGRRSRLVRYYDNRGIWHSSALIEDRQK
ncbi:MAG: DUF3598 family protein [Cyanobacteria bacterium P01_D01_bin.1]